MVILVLLVVAALALLWLVLSVSTKAKRTEKNIKKAYQNVDDASTFYSAVSAGAAVTGQLIDMARSLRNKKKKPAVRSKKR